jgi:hypothetical protein
MVPVDADSDAQMADYGTDFSDDVDQNYWGLGIGTRNRETGRFPIRPGTGNRGPGAARRGFPGLSRE